MKYSFLSATVCKLVCNLSQRLLYSLRSGFLYVIFKLDETLTKKVYYILSLTEDNQVHVLYSMQN